MKFKYQRALYAASLVKAPFKHKDIVSVLKKLGAQDNLETTNGRYLYRLEQKGFIKREALAKEGVILADHRLLFLTWKMCQEQNERVETNPFQ